jgi:hypothetical protein
MKKIALVLAALAATSSAAFAGDFAATLHYPKPSRVSQPAAQELDRTSTGSILRKIVSSKPQQNSDAVARATDDASNTPVNAPNN